LGSGVARLVLSDKSKFSLLGDFEIGQGVTISLSGGAALVVGGRHASSGSGITADTLVMIEKQMHTGKDVIVAWGCTITDSDWHEIVGAERAIPTRIGDQVWVAHGVSILKGADIPRGCVVAARSVVGARSFPECSLIAGTPAVVKREGVIWKR